MKKIIALVLALMMVMSLTAALAEQEVTLKVSSIWSAETEANRAPFLKTLEEFEAAYPNIKLEVE